MQRTVPLFPCNMFYKRLLCWLVMCEQMFTATAALDGCSGGSQQGFTGELLWRIQSRKNTGGTGQNIMELKRELVQLWGEKEWLVQQQVPANETIHLITCSIVIRNFSQQCFQRSLSASLVTFSTQQSSRSVATSNARWRQMSSDVMFVICYPSIRFRAMLCSGEPKWKTPAAFVLRLLEKASTSGFIWTWGRWRITLNALSISLALASPPHPPTHPCLFFSFFIQISYGTFLSRSRWGPQKKKRTKKSPVWIRFFHSSIGDW